MATPFLSIVIPVLNREKIVVRTLDSVAAQSLDDFELIVVDNGSTDNTRQVVAVWIENHPQISAKLVEEPEKGAARARNRGLDEAKGEWTMFFDSDDTMSPDLVEEIRLNADGADIVAWNVTIHQLDETSIRQKSFAKRVLFHTIFNGNFATQRYAARTSLFRKSGGWNATLRGWDDTEFGVRLALSSPAIRLLKGTKVDVYAQEESITGICHSADTAKWEDALAVMKEHLKAAGARKAVKWIDLRRAILAGQYHAEGDAAEGQRLISAVIADVKGKRWLYRFACRYTATRHRGAARLLGWLC